LIADCHSSNFSAIFIIADGIWPGRVKICLAAREGLPGMIRVVAHQSFAGVDVAFRGTRCRALQKHIEYCSRLDRVPVAVDFVSGGLEEQQLQILPAVEDIAAVRVEFDFRRVGVDDGNLRGFRVHDAVTRDELRHRVCSRGFC